MVHAHTGTQTHTRVHAPMHAHTNQVKYKAENHSHWTVLQLYGKTKWNDVFKMML